MKFYAFLLTTIISLIFVSNGSAQDAQSVDWLIDPSPFVSQIKFDAEKQQLTLTNGLAERRIALTPNAATISLCNLSNGEEFVRALAPEARVTIDGKEYPIGGLTGASVLNYFKEEMLGEMKSLPDAYRFERFEIGEIEERLVYKKRPEWLSRDLPWPPKGKTARLFFTPPTVDENGRPIPTLPNVEILYEIYDGLPLISKRLFVRYPADKLTDDDAKEFSVDSFVAEELRLVENESINGTVNQTEHYDLFAFSDYIFDGLKTSIFQDCESLRLKKDPEYTTQVNYHLNTLCVLEASPAIGPKQIVSKDRDFTSYGVWVLLYEGGDRERRGLAQRRAYRTLAPWSQENPLMFHKVSSEEASIRDGIEQCAETGFETLIISFGSGFNHESVDPEYRAKFRRLSDEAAAKGVVIGGYTLTSSRSADDEADNVQNPTPMFGVAPCLASKWGAEYLATLKSFMTDANFGILENDGPFPGDFCDSVNHPGHRCKEDSVWNQFEAQADLYRWCRERGIFVNQPDAYFLVGGTKTDMAYRETNWSLPRADQSIIERQNIFDGTWNETVSMGWMFVPLSQYHGGGAAATIEPLVEHLDHYDGRFANLLGAGVQACWRGPRLYDAPETKKVVKKWVDFYKANRRILDSDLIHLRRATGRDWDGILHVDPDENVQTRALAFFYNPTTDTIKRSIRVPLYYAGLTDKTVVRIGDSDLNLGEGLETELNAKCEAVIDIEIPAEKYAWATFEQAKK